MKSKTMILMILAIGCGLVASILTSRMLAQNGQEEAEKVTVLVARQKIALGTPIKEPQKLFIEKQFIKGNEPKGAITKYEDLKDRRLNKPINADVHVTTEDLDDKNGNGMGALIRPGYRAVTIKVNADTNVAGFVRPHSRVDVISTVRNGDQHSVSRIILDNMLVLAVDMQHVREADKVAQAASTVTLEAKPDEAEKLTMAGSLGELRLVLRSTDDEEASHTRGARPADVLRGATGGDAKEGENTGKTEGTTPVVGPSRVPDAPTTPAVSDPVKAVEIPKPPKTHKLTVVNGESVTTAVFILDKDGETTTEITKSETTAPTKKPEAAPAAEPAPAVKEPKTEKAPEGDEGKPEPKTNPKTGTRTPGQKVGQ